MRIDQDHIDAFSPKTGQALANEQALLGGFFLIDDRVGADLPENEVRLLGEHAAFEAGEHLAHVLSTDATIEHDNIGVGEPLT